MSKVTVVGAGNVGATVANVLAHKDIVREVVLLDIQGDLARGKALDTWQQAPIDFIVHVYLVLIIMMIPQILTLSLLLQACPEGPE